SAIPASSTTSLAPMRQAAFAVRFEQQPVERLARDADRLLELVGRATARCRTQDGHLTLAVRLGEGPQRGRLTAAGGADDTDDPIGTGRRVEDESALLVREVPLAEERPQERLPLRLRSVATATRDRKLDCLALDRQQVAGREPSRPPGGLFPLDELDAGEARELLGCDEDVVDSCPLRERAGDRADELGHRERRLRSGQPVGAEQRSGELVDASV